MKENIIETFADVCATYEFMGNPPVITEHTYHQEIVGYSKNWTHELTLVRIEKLEEDVARHPKTELYLLMHHMIHNITCAISHQHSIRIECTDSADADDLFLYVHEFANDFPHTHHSAVEFAE